MANSQQLPLAMRNVEQSVLAFICVSTKRCCGYSAMNLRRQKMFCMLTGLTWCGLD
ncbi:hypothetical protein AB205_0131360 [Aquarana catesbeiana]|uniref:Uncharacterized protein n=1 Tax=Aquarana catesbeiana TaxID=8400 RepID=A0A2G9R9Y1_AQUCT|nr:hypothetical protein AB205_0131360 [Aquarana catesbeiana]